MKYKGQRYKFNSVTESEWERNWATVFKFSFNSVLAKLLIYYTFILKNQSFLRTYVSGTIFIDWIKSVSLSLLKKIVLQKIKAKIVSKVYKGRSTCLRIVFI